MAGFGAVASRLYAVFSRNPRTARTVLELAAPGDGDRVLDVGCGAGGAGALAAGRIGAGQVAAVDPSTTFVAMVRKRVPGADVRAGSAEDVPFEDATFTVILSIASMHHWDDRERGLQTLVRKLAPEGRLLIAERTLVSDGHGITPVQTDAVVGTLSRLGQAGARVVERTAGKRRMTIIESQRPGVDH